MTRAKRPVASLVLELVVIVVAALGLALAIQAFVVKPYSIPSGSMLPTLHIDQRVLVNRLGTHFSAPAVGDIVVFHPPKDDSHCADPTEGGDYAGGNGSRACDVVQPQSSGQTFIKRVVGLPGDRISIIDGHVIRNGAAEKDAYIVPCDGGGSCTFPRTITIPRGDYYMMGDNRPDSDDSRFWGPVPRAWIIGRAVLTYWPPDQIGLL
ncbi:MAG: signal peptidase I [Solirubrobacterales bacterium]|nr:MAG: signal peptidase I [Solirubrobacterales bacterium]